MKIKIKYSDLCNNFRKKDIQYFRRDIELSSTDIFIPDYQRTETFNLFSAEIRSTSSKLCLWNKEAWRYEFFLDTEMHPQSAIAYCSSISMRWILSQRSDTQQSLCFEQMQRSRR